VGSDPNAACFPYTAALQEEMGIIVTRDGDEVESLALPGATIAQIREYKFGIAKASCTRPGWLKPALVLIMCGTNDIGLLAESVVRIHSKLDRLYERDAEECAQEQARLREEIHDLMQTLLGLTQAEPNVIAERAASVRSKLDTVNTRGAGVSGQKQAQLQQIDDLVQRILGQAFEHLRSMHEELHEVGVMTVALGIPSLRRVLLFNSGQAPRIAPDFEKMMRVQEYQDHISQRLKAWVDCLAPYPNRKPRSVFICTKDFLGTDERLWSDDGIHFSREGYALFGRCVAEQLT